MNIVNIDSDIRREAMKYAKVLRQEEEVEQLYCDILDTLDAIGRYQGEDYLEQLLEERSIEWVVKEYGL